VKEKGFYVMADMSKSTDESNASLFKKKKPKKENSAEEVV
jgi:hypothetical protein